MMLFKMSRMSLFETDVSNGKPVGSGNCQVGAHAENTAIRMIFH